MPGFNWFRSRWLLPAQQWCRKPHHIHTWTAGALQSWHSTPLGVPRRNHTHFGCCWTDSPLQDQRGGVSTPCGSHSYAYPCGKTFTLLSVGFLDANRIHRYNDALAHSEKARMCADYLTNSRSLLLALIQAWNLGVFSRQIEITAQITAVVSAQDFSNTLQTTCKYLPKESFACIPSLTAYQT